MTKLSQIQQGRMVRVISVDESATGRRLIELGIYPGREVSMLRRAPLMDPIQFSVGLSCLSLRASEADLVAVEYI